MKIIERVRVATVHVDKAFEMSREHESAAAYHTIRVDPGAYPVEVRTTDRGDRYVIALFAGICLRSGYGNKRYSSEEGQPSTVDKYPYRFELMGDNYYGRVEIVDSAALEAAYTR